MLVESDQVLFRCDGYIWPTEIWNVRLQKWEPYEGDVPKEIGWGNVVTADEAEAYKAPV
jgi:hypothetical protein